MTDRTRQNRVRRITLRVVVFLLLGAIVNVAVAWGCVLTNQRNSRPRSVAGAFEQATGYGSEPWEFMRWNRTGVTVVWWLHRSSPIGAMSSPATPAWSSPPRMSIEELDLHDGWHHVEMAAGWPCLSAKCSGSCTGPFLTPQQRVVTIGIAYGDIQQWIAQPILPTEPIWPGFAINTFLYAAILWLLFAAPGKLRRWRRIKRGLCPKCAYPVGTSEVCTECGAVVKGIRQTA